MSVWAINLYQTPGYYITCPLGIFALSSVTPSPCFFQRWGLGIRTTFTSSLGTGRKEATEEGMSLLCCELVDPLKCHQASLFQSILLVSTRDFWSQYTKRLYSACGLGSRPCLLTQPHLSSVWLALQTVWVLAKSTVPRLGLLVLTLELVLQGNWSRAVHCHLYKLQDCRVPRPTPLCCLSPCMHEDHVTEEKQGLSMSTTHTPISSWFRPRGYVSDSLPIFSFYLSSPSPGFD